MTDRVPGAPGQYNATVTEAELQKLQTAESFTITLTRDDQPITEGTPYSKAAVLPDELAVLLCPDIADPTPADALAALQALVTTARNTANAALPAASAANLLRVVSFDASTGTLTTATGA